ncbi:MAG: NH(3)-dependent NAD(+) synthetase [Candidatus Beckwithbacteria bacterium GW2011_GWB1_47_15]|uniref:NH(3)-dependent NAD(+) synthetase n=1 Tax=Candidatus Beckwithbacteria bacterium GW2011_GWB1_47_15 TaxID=1618371 RepID=A0A0G1RTJ7_9BACT|nr:MAG: NH(3)-dependent NAD(+) synthetase, NAD+ synthase [Candidatus Beckwithbacteria bacterium GW2011_GWC1_49_16]AQS30939.1 hypothetical protein [uncultured bacterium]KKU34893.1 MAG: NH(3)-dependent NAD(+) synthetase [Candidatus Beckwithbacteria bacterium GW2011_GWA1_46_30]KKU60487.1 MAG: NH(3)-dependent NAD(+) synthetase [Candidatus Beckwithbacteria bacterium GW2011_GWB1_47_15]KKU72362.1 MAG: NH(3)-dependent NAD(+) synthetase [Candidatus Beckwithbacteria bacterium GW2011_GWA2_47_25]OGD48254.
MVKKITAFIKSTLVEQGFSRAVVAVSGGVDSAVALALTVKALGPGKVIALSLPYAGQNITQAETMVKRVKLPKKNFFRFDITAAVAAAANKLKAEGSQVRLGNIIARTRMIYVYDQAKEATALVVGTENRSEALLGYYTRFGDEASDLEPLKHLYKTQVIKLAASLKIPRSIINQPPTAGLWAGQTDEAELGFSYQAADPILHLLADKKLDPDEVVKLGFDQKLVEKITDRLTAVDFKRHVPYSLGHDY